MDKRYAITIDNLSHRYPKGKQALNNVSFGIAENQILGVLGPNGSGKTTLFHILSTLIRQSSGKVLISGLELGKDNHRIRQKLGVTFQSPGLDGKLTVTENLRHHGHLYHLSGKTLERQIDQILDDLNLSQRSKDLVDKLSGGLKRRVEIAKALLPRPRILLLDEPSTGLDPRARTNLWEVLQQLRYERDMTIVLTTHFMKEAEVCQRLAILDQGQLIANGTLEELRQPVAEQVLLIKTKRTSLVETALTNRWQLSPQKVNGHIRVENARGQAVVQEVMKALADDIDELTWRSPTLDDVFLHYTGHRFDTDEVSDAS